ncbi:MAG: hypothetical protein AAFR53_09740 [Pseudomonadota bacterium]
MRLIARLAVTVWLTLLALGFLSHQAWNLRTALAPVEAAGEPRRAPARQGRLPVVAVAQTQVTEFQGQITGFATAEALRRVELSLPEAGLIAAVAPELEDGTHLEAGEEILRLDPTAAERALADARLTLARAEAEMENVARRLAETAGTIAREREALALRQAELGRIDDLRSRGGGTEQQRDSVRLSLLSAEGALAGAEAERASLEAEARAAALDRDGAMQGVAAAETTLEGLRLSAPIAGTFRGPVPVRGARLMAGQGVGAVIDETRLTLSLLLSPTERARLGAGMGQTVDLTRFGDGRSFEARVTGQGLSGDETPQLVLTAAITADPCGCLLPGDRLAFAIEEPVLSDVAILPASAVDAEGRALLLGAGDLLEDVALEVLRRVGDTVVIAAPSEPLTYVVTRTPRLGAGLQIDPRGGSEDTAGAFAPSTAG